MELIVMAIILAAVLTGQYLLYAKTGLKNVSYRLHISTPEAFEGDEIDIIEEIENAKWLPLPWIRTEISCSRWLAFKGQQQSGADRNEQRGLVSSVFVLKGWQKCRRVWKVRCEKRGVFSVENSTLTVSDLFGLAKPAEVFKHDQTVRVLPVPADLDSIQQSREAFIGDMQVQRFVLPDPFMISGAKEYTGREPMNRIHWAQTARTGTLMAYNNEFTTERSVMVVLNMQRTYADTRQKLSASYLEGAIKAAAFMLDEGSSARADVGIMINSAEPLIIEPASGYEHIIRALRALAELKNSCGEHIDDFLMRQDFHGYTDIVFISVFLSEKSAELLRGLTAAGKCVTVFTNELEETDFCDVRHIPHGRYYPTEGGDL